jgi:hypothetical protein
MLSLGLITWREFRSPAPDAVIPGLPRPWAYSGASIAFGFAALVGEVNDPLGTALAAAWTIAIFLGYFGAPARPANASKGVSVP